MQVTRREFLKLGGATAAASVVPFWNEEALRPRPNVRWAALTAADMPEPDLETLLLNRAAYGARPGDVEALRAMGPAAWIEQQIDFTAIDDSAVSARVAEELPTVNARPGVLLGQYDNRNDVITELQAATVYRMIFSPRLLHEVMVEFWSDHFSIYNPQDWCWALKTVDDRAVIRPNALSDFKTLLTASAHSPAMLNFLNNDVSKKGRPNENYGREIMELHSLGVAVDGDPYTEEDVKEVARCFTGFTWYSDQSDTSTWGTFWWYDDWHDNGSKNVLGQFIPASGGASDVQAVIDILTHHDATARHIAYKLVRRFVTDDPVAYTPELLSRVEQAYNLGDGDIGDMLRTIFQSEEFANSYAGFGGRISRPMDLVARSLRALGVQPDDVDTLPGALGRIIGGRGVLAAMGHLPFYWTTPDGYPDVKEAWTASATMLARWNLGLSALGVGGDAGNQRYLLNRTFDPISQMDTALTKAGDVVDFWIDRLLHRPMLDADREVLVDFLTEGGTDFDTLTAAQKARLPETVALILDSPYFQWR